MWQVLRTELAWWDAHGETVPAAVARRAVEALVTWLEWERLHSARVRALGEELRLLGEWARYCDQKVANREIRVWHFVIEKGP
jgi:hypothetical protein